MAALVAAICDRESQVVDVMPKLVFHRRFYEGGKRTGNPNRFPLQLKSESENLMSRVSVVNVTSTTRPVQHGMSYLDDGRTLLDKVNFEIPSGKCLGLVGAEDSGKMALTMGLVRIDEFDEGEVWINKLNIREMSQREFGQIRQCIQAVFPDSFEQLTPEFTLDQSFREILAIDGIRGPGRVGQQIDEAMERTGLSSIARKLMPSQLDKVERQLAALTRALLRRPELLILHDFAKGLDAVAGAKLLNRVKEITEELELTSLYLSDNLAVACHMGDEIAVLHRGSIIEQGPSRSVIRKPQHDYTKRLVSSQL